MCASSGIPKAALKSSLLRYNVIVRSHVLGRECWPAYPHSGMSCRKDSCSGWLAARNKTIPGTASPIRRPRCSQIHFHLMPPFEGDENQVETPLEILGQGQFMPEQIGTIYCWEDHSCFSQFIYVNGLYTRKANSHRVKAWLPKPNQPPPL